MMRLVVFFFGGGWAFFAGVALMLVAIGISFVRGRGWARIKTLLALTALIVIAISGTSLPIPFYVGAATLTGAWLIGARFESKTTTRSRAASAAATAIILLGGAGVEAFRAIGPTLEPAGHPRLYLFADSLSAGLSDNRTNNWPQILARDHGVDVSDYSISGAKTGVALRRAKEVELGDGIVVLEIGGNDLLGSTTDQEFERDLDQLLQQVCGQGRQVLLFELPLPPFRNTYGQIQRRLAASHQVQLIPKRVLASILTADGSTADSIHLTARGHERMAETVWQIIRSGYGHPTPNP